MQIVFLGTPQFAVPSLQALANAGHQLSAIFTQPDRPKGRGNVLTESPIKISAKELSLPVHQPERIRRPEQVALLRELAPELAVVVGYGQIIPQSIIDIPPHGILNVHASLLPKYRGAAPIQWAIANGEESTGVTIMQIDAGLDTGDMLLWADTPIGPAETAPELSLRLAPLGAELLITAIDQIERGTVKRQKQNDAEATLAPILKKEDGLVDWTRSAQVIYCRTRGFTPWPGAYTLFRGLQLSLSSVVPSPHTGLQSGVIAAEKNRVYVGCGNESTLELLEVQLPGKKRMTAQAFSNGYKPQQGERLGEPA